MHAHVAEAYVHLVGCLGLEAALACLLEALQALLILGRQLSGAFASLLCRTQLAAPQQKLLLLDNRKTDIAVLGLAGQTIPLLLLYDRLDCLQPEGGVVVLPFGVYPLVEFAEPFYDAEGGPFSGAGLLVWNIKHQDYYLFIIE